VKTTGSYGTNKGVITATALTDNTETCRVLAGAGESQNAIYMVPKMAGRQTVSKIYADVTNATATAITTIRIRVKEDGRAWATKRILQLTQYDPSREVSGGFTIPEKSLIKATATADSGSSSVNVHITLT